MRLAAPQPGPQGPNEFDDVVRRQGSFLQTVKAVAWSFFGVRKDSAWQQDNAHLNPVHVILAGLIAGALFVALLVLAANWVVSSGIAR